MRDASLDTSNIAGLYIFALFSNWFIPDHSSCVCVQSAFMLGHIHTTQLEYFTGQSNIRIAYYDMRFLIDLAPTSSEGNPAFMT
jgi:hypothetical protein